MSGPSIALTNVLTTTGAALDVGVAEISRQKELPELSEIVDHLYARMLANIP